MRSLKYLSVLGLLAFSQACNSGASTNTETEGSSSEKEPMEESGPKLEALWETDAWYPTNESVFYYQDQDVLYVSCIAGNPTEKDGKGHIARISTDGSIIDSVWASGFHAPKGMCVFQGRLYFSDIDRVVSISLGNPEDRLFYPVGGAQFLNDLCPGQRGVFISDMNTGKLHYLESGIVHTINESLSGLNGLAYHENQLYALSNQGLLKLSDGGEVLEVINSEVTGGDGLVPLGNNQFLASRWQGEIWFVDGSKATKMLDTKEANIQTADIGFKPSTSTLYVPRFFANKLSAYTFIKP